jgi:aspartyl-tRNA(Asn)/glutamyl-tRNA(Gln) amidotransferase subunit C
MKIEDLQMTALLAHLNMNEDELAASFPAFEQMLGFFAAMQGADEDRETFPLENSGAVSGISAAARIVFSDHFRSDNPDNNDNSFNNPSPSLSLNLLNNAGERDGRFIVIPNVL